MDYRLREHATKILKLQAEILSELEAMITELDAGAEFGVNRLRKLQADQAYWQERFTRLAYLSGGELTSE